MQQPYLEVRTPKGPRRLTLGDRPLTIGRHPDNVLALDETMASRFHCVIESTPTGFRLRDLGSKNGTSVNGQPVTETPLENHDTISIGETHMRLIVPDGTSASDSDIEEVTEADVVETTDDSVLTFLGDDEVAQRHAPPREIVADEEDSQNPNANHWRILHTLAESLADKSVHDADITLLNARGQVTHASQTDGAHDISDESRDTVGLFRALLLVCFRAHASDIHIEPKNDDYQVRIRVDGNMVDVVRFNREAGTRLASLVKILCDIDIAQRNIVQEGHFTTRLPDRRVDYRASFAPAIFGQKLVIRILDVAGAPNRLWDLHLPSWMNESLASAIQQDSGMVLSCGPTGSGKTTTLYAILRSLDVTQRNVVTIEDPVEIQLDGVTQIPVNDAQNNTFSGLLRSVLRQDPDVILVGEVRDPETARIAMQAAITGHLVFSTVHSRDTVGTIFRLLDLGVEPYMVAQGLHLIIGQRLVRQLCPYCKQPSAPEPEQLAKLAPVAPSVQQLFSPLGCKRCLGTGYTGRRAIFELLTATEELRDVILKKPNLNDIYHALEGTPFERLLHNGYRLVAEGLTSLDEVDRIVGSDRARLSR